MPFIHGKCVKTACRRVSVGGKLLTNYLKVRAWRGLILDAPKPCQPTGHRHRSCCSLQEVVSYRQWNMMDEFKIIDQGDNTFDTSFPRRRLFLMMDAPPPSLTVTTPPAVQ